MRRVDDLRSEDGQDLLSEMLLEPCRFVGRAFVGADHLDPFVGEHFLEQHPFGLLRDDQSVGVLGNRIELLRGRAPVHRQLRES